MIGQLKEIGLSDLEARCYLTLHEAEALTGYEVAKRVSSSRTNVYAALRALAEKGVCTVMEGDPVRYEAIPIGDVVETLRSRFNRTAQYLKEHLKREATSSGPFFTLTGVEQIERAAHRLIATAAASIVADLWAEDVPLVAHELLAAEARGVTVVLVVVGDCDIRLQNVVRHQRDEAWPPAVRRKFAILADGERSVLGSLSDSRPVALETGHPVMAEALLSLLRHDLLMQHIEADFGPALTDRYGQGYAKLIAYYTKEKGWPIL